MPIFTFIFWFVSYPRNHCQIQCNKAPTFSFKSFVALTLMFRCCIHSEFISGCDIRVNFVLLYVHTQFFQLDLLEDCLFTTECLWHPC